MDKIDSLNIRDINKRVITFQKFIIRRAYGLYYLIWALAIFDFLIFPSILFSGYLNINYEYAYIIYAINYVIVIYIAIEVSIKIFSTANKTYKLEYGKINNRFRPVNYIYIITTVLLLILFAYFFQKEYFYFAVYLYSINVILFAMGFGIRNYLKLSFKKMPLEGNVAFYTYNISAAGTILFFIISAFLIKTFVYYPFLMWFIAMFGWFFSSFYALYHAPDEVIENE